MRKLRVGVWLYGKLPPTLGGTYSYYNELANALNAHHFKDAKIVFLSDGKIYSDDFDCKKILWKPRKSKILKFFLKIVSSFNPFGKKLSKKLQNAVNKETEKLKNEVYQHADVIYYLTQNCLYPDIPYVYTLWDLGHYNSHAFPEFTMNGNFENRKKINEDIAYRALMIFTESETGKKECEKYMHVNEERVKVIPIFPSGVAHPKCLAVKPEKMERTDVFIHYPAQYWAHKNHYNLLMAMPTIIKAFPEIKLVLTGSNKGNEEYISKIITEMKLEKNILDLGFISLEEMRWLYENSHGLVFPSLLGPTNMPPLEAGTIGCSVACTNLPGHLEQLGDYGYYFDGLDSNDIAKQVIAMINDKRNGVKKRYDTKFTIDNAIRSLDDTFTKLRRIRFCWGENDKMT
jgi:glycosyltransferase involved in cell wall biosynthesis